MTGSLVKKYFYVRWILNTYLDWFFSTDVFIRAIEYENYSDLQQNIKMRHSIGTSLGYHIVNTKRIEWDFNLGPSYQRTQYNFAAANESDESAALSLSTLFEYQISSKIDYMLDYQMQFVSEESGSQNHHFKTGFEFIKNLGIDLLFYLDRIEKPVGAIEQERPQPNDYRIVISVGYQF